MIQWVSNTCHITIKMKPVDVKDNAYIDFKKEVNDKDPKLKFGNHVTISKYKNIFAKGYTPNWSVMIVHLIAGLIKKIWCYSIGCNCIKMSQYFPKPYELFGGDINVKVDLSSYATKTDTKNIGHVDASSLASLKTEVDKLDIDKLVSVPIDLSKLSDVVKNEVLKKTEYDKLVAEVDNIDTSGLL